MNKSRRKTLEEIMQQIADVKDHLELIKEEEEEYRDNMPENLQDSERYEKADMACYAMETAYDALDEALAQIEEAMQ